MLVNSRFHRLNKYKLKHTVYDYQVNRQPQIDTKCKLHKTKSILFVRLIPLRVDQPLLSVTLGSRYESDVPGLKSWGDLYSYFDLSTVSA